jgi:hypothetical protein
MTGGMGVVPSVLKNTVLDIQTMSVKEFRNETGIKSVSADNNNGYHSKGLSNI